MQGSMDVIFDPSEDALVIEVVNKRYPRRLFFSYSMNVQKCGETRNPMVA